MCLGRSGGSGWGWSGWGRSGGGAVRGRRAQNFAFFFSLSRHNFLSFFSLLEVLAWNFGGVFEAPEPESPNVHISGSRPSKTPPKFHERKLWREREQKREILGGFGGGAVRRRGGPAEGGPGEHPNLGQTHNNTQQHTDTHTTHNNTQHLSRIGLATAAQRGKPRETVVKVKVENVHCECCACSHVSLCGMNVVWDESGFGMKAVR